VLVTDIAMPLQDGHEMVQRLRESLGSRTPKVVIALSAFAAEKDTERSLSLGFDAHITKPFEPDFLVATIHERVLPLPNYTVKSSQSTNEILVRNKLGI